VSEEIWDEEDEQHWQQEVKKMPTPSLLLILGSAQGHCFRG
jgi:hypothetical protein